MLHYIVFGLRDNPSHLRLKILIFKTVMKLTWNKVIYFNSILVSAAPQNTVLIRNLPITQQQLNSNVYGTGI